jgi:hypothetical protein
MGGSSLIKVSMLNRHRTSVLANRRHVGRAFLLKEQVAYKYLILCIDGCLRYTTYYNRGGTSSGHSR